MSLLTPPGRHLRRSGNVVVVVVVLAIVAFLMAAVGAAAWYFFKGRQSGGPMTQVAAKVAPANTQALVAFDLERAGLDLGQQQKILETFLKSKELQLLNERLKQSTGMTLEQDFLPWITSSGAVILVPAEGKRSLLEGIQPKQDLPPFRALAVLKVRDQAKAQASLDKAQAKASSEAGMTYRTEDFQGTTLHLPSKPGAGPAWALHKGFLYVGFVAADLKMGLTPPGKGQSLADQAGYKNALGRVPNSEGALVYADLAGILAGAPLATMGSPDAEKLVAALRYLVMGSGVSGGELRSDWCLAIDPAAAGPLGPKVFSPSHNVAFPSVEASPKDIDTYFALNLRMLWDVAYEVAGAFPEGKKVREQPARSLKAQGLDLDKDILGMLSGEFAYSARNMGRLQALQFETMALGGQQDPQASLQAFQQVPFVVSLGLKDRAALDRLLGKVPQVNMLLTALPATEVEGVKVYAPKAQPGGPEGAFAVAISDKAVMIGVNQANKSLEAGIKARSTKENLGALPGFAKVLGLLNSDNKAFLVAYQDTGRVYAEAAAEMKSSGKVSPEFVQALELLSKVYGATWSAAAVRPDGLCGVSTTVLNPGK